MSNTYWPVMATLLNLAPSERFKAKNMLLLSIIPGPNEPKDLTSFLRPFIDEVIDLSCKGRKMFEWWDGITRNVRVRLLFVLGDLPAMKKLTHLKGYNGLVPCRYCTIRGIFCNHSYFLSSVIEEVTRRKTKKRKVKKQL